MLRAGSLIENPFFVVIVLGAMLIAWHRWDALPRFSQRLWLGVAIAIVARFGLRAFEILEGQLAVDAVWDFFGFYVHGRAAWLGLDIYDNDAIRSVMPFPAGPTWERELLVAGSVYPPFTSFLFAPFGAFPYTTAFWLWSAFNGLVVALTCVLAGRWFFREHPHGAWAAALILLLLRASVFTTAFQQSSFCILLLLVLLLHHSSRALSGVWLALAVVVKPVATIVALFPLALGRWRLLLAGALTGLALIGASALIWGPQGWVAFLENPPTKTLPVDVTAERVNQSIGARMTRHFGWHERGERITEKPLFLAVAGSMLLLTGGVTSYRRRENPSEERRSMDANAYAFGAVVALALAIYPASKQHYGVLLALPAWVLWSERTRLPHFFAPEAAALFISATWGIVAIGLGGHSWLVFLAWWALMLALAALPPEWFRTGTES